MSSGTAEVDSTFAALADPTRRGVVELLRDRPRRAGELAHRLGTSPPAMSRHLRVLRTGGLIEEQRQEEDARVRVYRLRPERFHDLQDWLDRVSAFWDEQLDAFRTYAERAPQSGSHENRSREDRSSEKRPKTERRRKR